MTHPNGWLLLPLEGGPGGQLVNLCYAYQIMSQGPALTIIYYIIPGTDFSGFVRVPEEIGSLTRRLVATPAFAEVTP